MGMADFFAMEAGDYLERLDAVVSPPTPPDAREFTRLSRALRGSAIMASQQTIAAVAAGLEQLARGLAEERFAWDDATRLLAIRAVDDLKVLVRASSQWGSAEETRAQQIIRELERFGGRATEPRRAERASLDAGTRAFIAREGAAVGSALDRAARALALSPRAFESLDSVLRAMQPLRGIASLSDLPPLPDLLGGIERAIGEVKARPDGAPSSGELFDVAARAVSKTAQEIATKGEADTDSAETRRFVELLGRRLEPVEAAARPSAEGEPAESPAQLDQLELVSHAEYLKQFAADLEAAQSDTQRALRTHSLAPTLRALSMGAGGPLAQGAAHFARATRDAVARGAAVHNPQALAKALREAGNTMSAAAQGNEPDPGPRMEAVIGQIRSLATADAAREEPPPEPATPKPPTVPAPPPRAPEFRREPSPVIISPPPIPPPETEIEPEPEPEIAEPADEPIPIGPRLIRDEPEVEPAVTAEQESPYHPDPAVPMAGENGTDLAAGYAEFHRLVEERGLDQGTVAELLGTAEDAQQEAPPERTMAATAPSEDDFEPVGAVESPAAPPAHESPLDAIVPLDEDVVRMTPPAHSSGLFDEPDPDPDMPSPFDEMQPVAEVSDIEPTYAADLGGTEESPLDDIVPISQFCYSGTAALRRAISLRDEVRAALEELSDGEHVAELIEEIFDLVQLGIHRPSE